MRPAPLIARLTAAAAFAAALPSMAAGPCGAPVGQRAPSQPASYAFATELGSGIYDFCGRQLQIYRLPLAHALREPRAAAPGLRLTLPVTVGFLDFSPRDVIAGGLPSRIDSLSFVPGIELELPLREGWRLKPYVRLGGSFASASLDAWLYGAGLRSELDSARGAWDRRLVTDLGYAGASFRGDLAGDDFARLRTGVELRRGSGWRRGAQELDFSPYALLDLFADTPRAPVARAAVSQAQLELGISFGTRPGLRVRGIPLPRAGVGYRFAGDLTGWRIVFGAPF